MGTNKKISKGSLVKIKKHDPDFDRRNFVTLDCNISFPLLENDIVLLLVDAHPGSTNSLMQSKIPSTKILFPFSAQNSVGYVMICEWDELLC